MTHGNRESGEGRVGLIIAVLLVGIVAFMGIKIIPVRVTAYEFKDVIREECRYGAVRNNDATVAKRILDQASEMEIPLQKKNLLVKRTRSEMVITAKYEQSIDLAFTTYVYRFDHKERAPLF